MNIFKYLVLVMVFASSQDAYSQTFSNTNSNSIAAYSITDVPITVTGIGVIDDNFGLESVCIDYTTSSVYDDFISLRAPDGTEYYLSYNNSYVTGSNYSVTCFNSDASTPIWMGTAPFNGSYQPTTSLAVFNNGSSADGTWYLSIERDKSGTGTLNSVSLTFSNSPTTSCANVASDNCSGDTPLICDFNGYCGTTSAYYTVPAGEDAAISGCGYSLNNNSWVEFVPNATSATIDVVVEDCEDGSGVQFGVYESDDCNSFTNIDCATNPFIGSETMTFTGLTPGNSYYLMIDGYAGDVCNYTFSVSDGSGVAVAEIEQGEELEACIGDNITLSVPDLPGVDFQWTWPSGSATTAVININNVTPPFTVDLVSSGVCNNHADAIDIIIDPNCCAADAGTSSILINNIDVTDASNEYDICWGEAIEFKSNNDYVLPPAASSDPAGLGWAFFNSLPTLADPTANTGFINYKYSASPTKVNDGLDLALGTYWAYQVTMDDICNTGGCDAQRGHDVNSDGCFQTGQLVKFTLLPSFSASISSSTGSFDFCQGESISLDAGSFSSYVWSPSGSSQTIDVSNSGSFSVTVTDVNGCTATDNVTATRHALPTIVANINSPLCVGATLDLSESGGDADTWVWTSIGNFDPSDIEIISHSNVQISEAGTYKVVGTITATGCKDSSEVSLVVNPNPSINLTSNSPICVGETLNLNENGGEANSWVWVSNTPYDPANISNPTTSNALATYTGDYTVTAEITATGCTSSNQISVIVNTLPNVQAHADPVSLCEGSSLTLYGSGANTYSWMPASVSDNVAFVPGVGTENYTLTGTNTSTNCSNTDAVSVTVYPIPTAWAGDDATICENETYALAGSYGGGANSISWTSSGNGTFSNASAINTVYTLGSDDITAGSVTLTITTNDPAGDCEAVSDEMILTVNTLDNPSFTYDGGTFCITGTNPIPTTIATGGGVFSSTGSLVVDPVSGAIDLSASGTLQNDTLRYTTNGSCPTTSYMLITITSGFNADFNYSDLSYCQDGTNPFPDFSTGGSSGVFSSNPTGVSFVNTGTGEIDLANTTSNSYWIVNTIAANGGCAENKDSVQVSIDEAANVFAGDNATVCESEITFTLSDASLSGSATSLSWTTSGDGIFDDANTVNPVYTFGVNDLASSIWLKAITNDPGTSCQAKEDSLELTINLSALVDAGDISATICEGESYALVDASFGGNTQNVNWSSNGDGQFDDANTILATYSPGTNDIINGTVKLLLSSDDPTGPCSIVKDSIIIIINSLPNLDLSASTPICAGDSLYLFETGAEATNWLWTGPNAFTANISSPIIPNATVDMLGKYYVEISDGNCSLIDSVDVVIHPSPTVSAFAVEDTICADQTISFDETGSDSDTWLWTSVNGFTSTEQNPFIYSATADTSAWYTVKGSISATSCISIDSIYIKVNSLPEIVADSLVNASCMQENAYLRVNVQGNAPFVYTWSEGNSSTNFIDSLSEGSYSLTVSDINNCASEFSQSIVNNGGGNIELTNQVDINCFGDSTGIITITNNNAYPNFDYYTLLNGLVIDSLKQSSNGIYTVTGLAANSYELVVVDAGACQSSITVSIGSNFEQLVINESVVHQPCYGDTKGEISINLTGGSAPFSFAWAGPDNFSSINQNLLLLETGVYNLSITDSYGCIDTLNNVEVRMPNLPGVTLSINNDIQCFGLADAQITAQAFGGTQPYEYKWTNGDWINYGAQQDSLPAGEYHLLLTDTNNCLISDTTINLEQYDALQIRDSIIFNGNRAEVLALVSGGTPSYLYTWEDAEENELSTTASLTNLLNGSYVVYVNDFYDCTDSLLVDVEIPFAIPNLISPNDDGLNDTWKIPSIESYNEIHIEIYNRWGNIIFTFDGTGFEYGDLSNQFDGTYNGEDLPIGAYVYILEIKDTEENYNGVLNILRTK